MAGAYRLVFRDYDKEKSVMDVPIAEADALTVDGIVALLATLKMTIQAITIGVLAAETIIGILAPYVKTPAADTDAQREVLWDVFYTDSVTLKEYKSRMGTANLDLLANNSPVVPATNATYVEFETAFEDLVVSPDANAVTLNKVVQRGANY